MNKNPELDLAWSFVNQTNKNIFLTGKAGTGKTTFLHKIKTESFKRLIVVAPTGVAAINAKGVTIHSFFQMPFGPLLPDESNLQNNNFNRKFSKNKINLIKSLDLLIIDEVSMVRADLLDGIDRVLKRYKKSNKVFGGIQVLMIGDLHQLSPVIIEQEWDLLKPYYKKGFFFSSHAFQSCNAITIELNFVYRQVNHKFINILNQIRNNSLSKTSTDELNKRYIPNFKPNPSEGYIYLTTHNRKAEQVNIEELNDISSKSFSFKAKINGKFPEHSYPNDENLLLKVGAQVMFIKNDSSQERRYFNGKIGKVIKISKDEVIVRCPDDDFNIVTTPEVWENINYTVDSDTKAITENKIGSFTQIPLRLAWAITIHKSQGLTFEKAIIDTQAAFAHGQTYVALSRCKSIEGLVLKSKINSNQIISDSYVNTFNKNSEEDKPSQITLEKSRITFQLDSIFEIFNFHEFIHPLNRILDIFYKNRNSIEGKIEEPILTIKDQAIIPFLKIAKSFHEQLKTISIDGQIPENNKLIQERFKKALEYFISQTETIIVSSLNEFSFTTDNKEIEKDITNHFDILEELIATKQLYFDGLANGFNTSLFLELRAKSAFISKDKPKKEKRKFANGAINIELAEELRILRNDIAQENDLIHYQIFTQKALYEMCETLPTTKRELLQVNGMGKVRVEKYGQAILSVINSFCENNDIEIFHDYADLKTIKPKKAVGDTKKQSLNLFKEGKTIQEIATERELNENTIFGHLASYIASKEIHITDLMSTDHYNELKEIIPKTTFENLSDLKHQLDEKYSYGELRLVLEDLNK